MINHDKALENSQLCTYFTEKMYWRTCSSIYGNVLKIVTVENDTKFP